MTGNMVFTLLAAKTEESETTIIVNVGVGHGQISKALRLGNPKAKIYSVDDVGLSTTGGLQNERNAFREDGMIEQAPFPLQGTSLDWASEWPFGEISLICINNLWFRKDNGGITKWLPRLIDRGFISFLGIDKDDFPYVTEVVNEHFDLKDAIIHRDNVIVFRVKKGDGDGSIN